MEKLYVSADGLTKMKADLVEMNERRMKVAAAIEQVSAGLDVLSVADWCPEGPDDAAAGIREVEALGRLREPPGWAEAAE